MATIGARLLLATSLCLAPCAGGAADSGALPSQWIIEQGTDPPSYAAIAPTATNTNIDTVVLACEEGMDGRVLQLQLYLTDDGPLQPSDAQLRRRKAVPHAVISIDRRRYPVVLLFADGYAVLADTVQGRFPALTPELVSAMQTGAQMTLQFDLLEEEPGEPPSLDSEAVVDLQAPGGREAIAAVRRCAEPPQLQSAVSRPSNQRTRAYP